MLARSLAGVLGAALLLASTGCSTRQLALEGFADSLGGTAGAFASDEDPELVAAALPFALKLMESIHGELPEHEQLLLALTSGFTQYGYAFVELPATALEEDDFDAYAVQLKRAARLYLRAHGYGVQALELRHPGLGSALAKEPTAALANTTAADVPFLYWTGASLGLAISASKGEAAMIGRLPVVKALMTRVLALDEAFGEGAVHEFFVTFIGADDEAATRKHYERALELSGGRRATPHLALAEAVCIKKQDRAEFTALLNETLAVDLDASPADRLANVLAQRRARRLLTQIDDLFLD